MYQELAYFNSLSNLNRMKKIDIGDQSILLVKEKDNFYAVGNKCSHYGAPLTNGKLISNFSL